MKPRRTLGVVAAAGVLVSTLAGCGGGSDDSSAGVQDQTIKIGISSIQSGPAASSGVGLDCTVKFYLDAAQKSGDLDGYTFDVISRDHQYDPARAANIAREFTQENVFAVLTDGTATMKAAIPALQPKGIPIFAYADGALFKDPEYERMYGINPDYAGQARQGAKFILENLGVTKTALVYLNSEAGEPAAEAFPAYVEANGGQVVDSEAIAATATDYAAQAQNLKNSGAEAVYANLLDTGLAAIQKAADAIGYHPAWVSWHAGVGPTYYKLAGDLAAGTYAELFQYPRTGEATDANAEQFREAITACGDSATEAAAAFGAGIVRAVQNATEGGKELTQDSFVDAIDISGEPLGGVPSVTWDDTTHAGSTQTAVFQVGPGPEFALEKKLDYSDLPE